MERIFQGVSGKVRLSEPELYVDNASRNRSGHMSHALTEYAPGQVLSFNSNCSPLRCNGHAAYGWIEYRRSLDGGRTWGEIHDFPYARRAFLDGKFTISVEKAVTCDDGTIVAFCLRNTPYHEICCEPWLTPMYVRSFDGGKTWTEERELSPFRGRVYDAVYFQNAIYVLEFCNDAEVTFTGNLPEHVYRIFKSDDRGETFHDLGVIPMDTAGRGYGSMLFRPDGSLVVYAYNVNDECHLDTVVSRDCGHTWSAVPAGKTAKGIRNPQTAILNNTYILHGRAANGKGFVFYTSSDGLQWDDGYLFESEKRSCYYSNNLPLRTPEGKERLLVQYSETYRPVCVNVMHLWLEFVD